MGCGTSIYDNPGVTKNKNDLMKLSTHNSETYKPKPNKITPLISAPNNESLNDNNPVTRSCINSSRSDLSDHSSVMRSRNNGIMSRMTNSTVCEQHNDLVGILANGSARSRKTSRADSPVNSEASSFRPIKRVIFTENLTDSETQDRENRSLSSHNQLVSVTLNDKKRAKRKREKALRNRLLSRLTEAEDMSAAIMLDNERLSIGSSLSRTTSRTASPYPVDAPLTDHVPTSNAHQKNSDSSTNHNADISSTNEITDNNNNPTNQEGGDVNSANRLSEKPPVVT